MQQVAKKSLERIKIKSNRRNSIHLNVNLDKNVKIEGISKINTNVLKSPTFAQG